MKLKLEFKHEERWLAHEEGQWAAEGEAQNVCDAEKALQDAQLAEAQKAWDLRLAELREACQLRELELKAEQEKAPLKAKKEANMN